MRHPLSTVHPLSVSDCRTQRRKSLKITPFLIVEMLKIPTEGLVIGDRRVFPGRDPLPMDATVEAVRITNRGEIEIDIESAEFPETNPGDQLIPFSPMNRIEYIQEGS